MPKRKYSTSVLLFPLVVISFVAFVCSDIEASEILDDNQKTARAALIPAGIIVPKRSALITGLNEHFKHLSQSKQTDNKTSSVNGSQPQSFFTSHLPNILPGSRGNQLLKPKRNQIGSNEQFSGLQDKQALYLDRHHQQLLAANPNLAITNSILSKQLTASHNLLFGPSYVSNGSHQAFNDQLQSIQTPSQSQLSAHQDGQQQQQQLYRGYSLIELEIKNELDRHYVQDLYANLSAIVNEQASNLHASPSVSPYVDVDFWSSGRLVGPNDQIDIMVSPRSRSLLLGQLARARIKHRVKIDDIQARIDRDQQTQLQLQLQFDDIQQQQQPQAVGTGSGDAYRSGTSAQAPYSDGRPSKVGATLSGRLNTHSIPLAANQKQRESSLHARQASDIPSTNGNGNLINSSSFGSKPMNDSAFFENYQRLATINQYLESIVQRNSDVAQVTIIGRSSQGRHLRVLKLGYERLNDYDSWTSSKNEPLEAGRASSSSGTMQPLNASQILSGFFRRQEATQKVGSIWLDGGTHAREWISPSTVLYLSFRLSDNHFRCNNFFINLKSMVSQYEQSIATSSQAQDPSGQTSNRQIEPSELDMNLLNGINDINIQLLTPKVSGKKANSYRPRTELEQMLELLAKSPQVLASEYGCDLEVDQLLRKYTFYIMPVLNPDGYEYSHTHNRLWRKTRSTSNHPIYRHFCLGVDPNRNYDAKHGSTGSSSHPCSQTYAGATPFTEPETRHQSNFVYANRLGMKMYISFHSYSQMILLPLSHSKQSIPDLKDLESVGMAAVKAIEETHGTVYKVGQSASILYTASGTASDWAYEKANIKYSYTIELRDSGSHGFLLPRQQIIPTGEETFNGLLAMIAQMEKNGNLLTSKSNPASSSKNDANFRPTDYNRASQDDLDQLNSISHNRNRPILESVHSVPLEPAMGNVSELMLNEPEPDTSASHRPVAVSTLPGARDRKVTTDTEGHNSSNGSDNQPDIAHNSDHDPYGASGDPTNSPLASVGDQLDPLGQPLDSMTDNDPDASFAFEGEGELMEPAIELIDSNYRVAHVAESKLSSRRMDSSRRIILRTRTAPNGRNSINSPAERDEANAYRRESSGYLLKRNKAH